MFLTRRNTIKVTVTQFKSLKIPFLNPFIHHETSLNQFKDMYNRIVGMPIEARDLWQLGLDRIKFLLIVKKTTN